MQLPFRLGTTSYIYPDRWLPNVQRLAGRVKDIEILFFDLDDAEAQPGRDEIQGLYRLKRDFNLTYSLHTPLGASLASEDERLRQESVEKVWRAVELSKPFEPEAYVVHVYCGDREHDRRPADVFSWRSRACRSLKELLNRGMKPQDLCIETLDYPFRLIEPVVDKLGLSVAVDVGHLYRDGSSDQVLLDNLFRTRIIQWHGVDPSDRDHRSLAYYPRDRAIWLLNTLRESYRGVLTLEVFREQDFEESLAVVESLAGEGAQSHSQRL